MAEIEAAEARRSRDPTAMDIMNSRIKVGATLKEVTAELRARDPRKSSSQIDDGTGTDWLLMGLQLEDEQ